MAKIGVIGGTFDPIHNGHMALAECAKNELSLDLVLFIPNHSPWMKKYRSVSSANSRLGMVESAVSSHPDFQVSTIEIEAGGESYTYQTLESLRKTYPADDFYLILGSDAILQFSQWKHPERIMESATLVTVCRGGYDDEAFMDAVTSLEEQFGKKIELLSMEPLEISSTYIRSRCYLDEDKVAALLPEAVYSYIRAHGLYRAETDFKTDDKIFEKIKDRLKKDLSDKRYTHTLGVAYTASCLAMAHGESRYTAYLAGLLHDCAKCFSVEEKLKLAKKAGLTLNEAQKENPDLLHAEIGSYVAKETYGITSEEVLDAIACHTTGKPGMNTLEQIVFIADYIEPNRKILEGLPEIRYTAFRDLDKTCVMILEHTLDYLKAKGACIDRTTEETYLYYKRKAET
ncbi:MAG: nicotinate-nucleotide adenylyltransferase [Lachnospiraceae bacterium]|nr:nicotinate-nucleotide adenylyltransferase [Lachnospiraceae bacterium]